MVKWKKVASTAGGYTRLTVDAAKEGYTAGDRYIDVDYDTQLTPGLTPIGDSGWYRTPDEPADPQDCDRYPDSPFCGGNPFTKTPIGLEPEIIINECDIGFKSTPVLGFVKLPPVHLVYRKESCRNLPPPKPFEPPDSDFVSSVPIPFSPCLPDSFGTIILFFNSLYSFYEKTHFWYGNHFEGTAISNGITKTEIVNFDYPYTGTKTARRLVGNNYRDVPVIGTVLLKRTENLTTNEFGKNNRWENAPFIKVDDDTYTLNRERIYSYDITNHESSNYINLTNNGFSDLDNFITLWLFNPQVAISNITRFNNYQITSELPSDPNGDPGVETVSKHYQVAILCRNPSNDYNPPLPNDYNPPLPKDKKECCMTCCDDSLLKILLQKVNKLSAIVGVDNYPTTVNKSLPDQDGNLQPTDIAIKTLTEYVEQVYKDVDKTSKVIGIDDYPVTLPKSFITKHQGFVDKSLDVLNALDNISGANIIDDEQVDNTQAIPSLTQMFAWYIERFDEIMGQFEIPIEIKDSDPTTPGEQPKGFKLPNVAESIGEMFGLLLQIAINSETLVNMNTRIAISTTQDMQQNFKTYAMTNAITEWLGFKYKEETQKMPVMFDIGKENMDELLVEKEIDVPVIDFEDKQNFHDTLLKLSEAAAIIKARYFRKLDIKGDMTREIIDLLKGYASNANKVNGSKDDFDQFIKDAELGFTNTSGIKDPLNPYGKDFSQRPKIRELGNTSEGNE